MNRGALKNRSCCYDWICCGCCSWMNFWSWSVMKICLSWNENWNVNLSCVLMEASHSSPLLIFLHYITRRRLIIYPYELINIHISCIIIQLFGLFLLGGNLIDNLDISLEFPVFICDHQHVGNGKPQEGAYDRCWIFIQLPQEDGYRHADR